LQTNCPFLTKQQQNFTSLPVSLQIIFLEAANPGDANTAAANKPKMTRFIWNDLSVGEYSQIDAPLKLGTTGIWKKLSGR